MDHQWYSVFDNSLCQPWLYFCYRFDAPVVNSLTISIPFGIRQLSLSIHWWFQGLQGIYFRWRFMDQQWHSVFYNSMRQPWIYFCYRFDALVVNSLTMSVPCDNCHSVFIDDFKVYKDSIFADDFWSVVTLFSLAIVCVYHDSVFSIDFMCPLWISFCCRFHASSVTQFSMMISCSTVTLFSPMVFALAVT